MILSSLQKIVNIFQILFQASEQFNSTNHSKLKFKCFININNIVSDNILLKKRKIPFKIFRASLN